MYVQARRSSQSEAVALQAIRNAKGNNQCVDCEAPSELQQHLAKRAASLFYLHPEGLFECDLWPPSSSCRSNMGESQPGRPDLHRVLRDPPEPGDSPVSSSLAGPGRLARRAHAGSGRHREPHGQQRVGEPHAGPDQTHTERNTVGSRSGRFRDRIALVQRMNRKGSIPVITVKNIFFIRI